MGNGTILSCGQNDEIMFHLYMLFPYGSLGGAQLSVSEQASVVVGGTTYNCFQQNLVAFRYSRYLGMAVPDFSGASLYPGVKVHSHA